jgi:arylsulfate sulfotransferase
MNAQLRKSLCFACLLLLAACGKNGHERQPTLAAESHASVIEQTPGTTPFIMKLTLFVEHFDDLRTVSYTIAPKPGTHAKPVSVSFERSWLEREADYNNFYRRLTIPVFGLYANYHNDVSVSLGFNDGSLHTERVAMDSAAYTEPAAFYDSPTIKTPRGADDASGVDFIAIHNGITTPVVIDTDGNLRWVGRGVDTSISAIFTGTAFYVGSLGAPTLFRVNLNGTWIPIPLASPSFTDFHHDLTPGKTGYLAEVDAFDNGVQKIETILAEITADGQVLRQWDMAPIFRNYMLAHGDDPANFVRDGIDWFHMNSAIYDPSDDTLIVSSRENFVAKLDYETGAIKWLFGDTTKHWYVDYPSLRALALTLTSGKAPIGQHALSLRPNGELLLFNNGFGSLNQPPGTATGETRSYSAPSRYVIDEKARTAAEVWTYTHDGTLYSDLCSSAFETTPGHYLVAYAVADQRTRARILAIDSGGAVAFDFEYPTFICNAVFMAVPIDFAALSLK